LYEDMKDGRESIREVRGEGGRGVYDVVYLSESLDSSTAFWAFLRFGVGMRHSIWKATQFVHGTPKLAASQRTCNGWCEYMCVKIPENQLGIGCKRGHSPHSLFCGFDCALTRGLGEAPTLRAWHV